VRQRRRPSAERVALAAGLVVVWVLLWGDAGAGTVIGGALVAGALLVVYPLSAVEPVEHRIRPLRLLQLGAFFFYELVASTIKVGRDVVVGPRRVATGIVACPLRVDVDGLITFLANTVALSPGTLPVHVSKEPLVMYVHVLRLDDPDAVRAQVSRLEELAVRAVGSAAMVEACRHPAPHPSALERP